MKTLSLTKIAFSTTLFCLAAIPALSQGQQWYQPAQSQNTYTSGQQYYQSSWGGRQNDQQVRPGYPSQSSPYGYQQAPAAQPPAQPKTTRAKASHRPAATSQAPVVRQDMEWLTNFESARSKAYKQGRPLVVLFVHHGCPECDKMDGYLAQPGAMQTIASAVKVRIEFQQNPEVVNRFGVKFTPTFLVLTPQGGEVYREVGALSPERLRQIQPAIEALVSAPPTQEKRSGKNSASLSSPSPDDQATTKTVASL